MYPKFFSYQEYLYVKNHSEKIAKFLLKIFMNVLKTSFNFFQNSWEVIFHWKHAQILI